MTSSPSFEVNLFVGKKCNKVETYLRYSYSEVANRQFLNKPGSEVYVEFNKRGVLVGVGNQPFN